MVNAKAQDVLKAASSSGIMIATAESCTGGMVIAALTDIAGSSAIVDRGFITYSNEAKISMLGVRAELIATHGAVSEQVVRAMAEGAVAQVPHRAKMAISISGIAGPGGGSIEKPVGLVWFGLASEIDGKKIITAEHHVFSGNRAEVRDAATRHALGMMLDQLAALSSLG